MTRVLEGNPTTGYYWTDPDPLYPCANAECENAATDEETYHRCEVCQRQMCADCLKTLDPDRGCEFCPACAVCDYCAAPAKIQCEGCGELLCAKDARQVISETGAPEDPEYKRVEEFTCRTGCRLAQRSEAA